jgi:transposase
MVHERIPGISQKEWDALPIAVRVYIEFLEKQVARIPGLESRIASLEAQLAKNSQNSHKPPSSDGPIKPRRTQSERTQSGKKPGGQPGHSGNTLRQSKNPDHRVRHQVTQCKGCHKDLSNRNPDSIQERQIFDLPLMKILCTAHEMESKVCPDCGRTTEAEAPGILATEQGSAIYGPELRAFGVYLSQGQLLPYERTCELIEDLFGHKISAGTLAGWIHKASVELFSTTESIADALANHLGSVHFDETGVPCEKKNQWLHSASNEQLTHFAFHPKRGKEAMDDIGILPRFEGTAIHDRWGSYMNYENCRHGLCGSHLLRDLRFAWEHEGERWARNMRRLFGQMNVAVKEAKAKGQTRFNSPTINYWERRYLRILEQGFSYHEAISKKEKRNSSETMKRGRKEQKYGKNLLDALDKYQDSVLLFRG